MTSAQAMAQQSEPPRKPVSSFFKNGQYPLGETQDYKDEYALLLLIEVLN